MAKHDPEVAPVRSLQEVMQEVRREYFGGGLLLDTPGKVRVFFEMSRGGVLIVNEDGSVMVGRITDVQQWPTRVDPSTLDYSHQTE